MGQYVSEDVSASAPLITRSGAVSFILSVSMARKLSRSEISGSIREKTSISHADQSLYAR